MTGLTYKPGVPLTARETQVLSAIAANGCTAKEAARALGISHRTVEVHMSNAIAKLGARNQLHAVLLWDRSQRTAGVKEDQRG